MKKIITTVGTSLFINYFNDNSNSSYKSYYENLKNKPFSKWDDNKKRIVKMQSEMINWAKNNNDASAEISTILKIQEEYKDEEFGVYLLATDTILSALAAEIIKEVFQDNDKIKVFFNAKNDAIKDLQVNNRANFLKHGLPNLINRINQVSCNYWENIVFNISGGYKGVIPYLTIMASINRCEIKYIFEDSDELITIPQLPIKIDEEIFDEYTSFIEKLQNGIDNYSKEKQNNFIVYKKLEDLGLVEYDGNIAFLSPIGEIFYSKYKNIFFFFYTTDEIFAEIENSQNIKHILKTRFEKNLTSKTENKNGHLVYDDGNNPYRIFYFKKNEKIYIYKVFENHDIYERFLNTPKETDLENNFFKTAILRKIKKEDSYV